MSTQSNPRRHPLLLRLSGIELLVALTALFVSLPFLESFRAGALIESILFTIVLIAAVLAIAADKRTVVIASTLAVPAVIGRWLQQVSASDFASEVFLVCSILFVGFVIIKLLQFVLKASSVNTEVLCASISAYLLLSLAWTLVYWLVVDIVPNAFAFNVSAVPDQTIQGFNGLYFSIVTMTTLGYGDITPASKVARMLAAMEAMTGMLYVAVLIARLVALYSRSAPDER